MDLINGNGGPKWIRNCDECVPAESTVEYSFAVCVDSFTCPSRKHIVHLAVLRMVFGHTLIHTYNKALANYSHFESVQLDIHCENSLEQQTHIYIGNGHGHRFIPMNDRSVFVLCAGNSMVSVGWGGFTWFSAIFKQNIY